MRGVLRRILLLAFAATAGCVSGRAAVVRPSAGREWATVLARAEAAVNGRRYSEADRLLADFASHYPGTDEALETAYWRGVLRLDPGNRDASAQAAASWFESYLESDGALQHRVEAEVLRRLAGRLEALSTALASAGSVSSGAASQPAGAPAGDRTAELKAKDAEVQKLKDDLAKANDELERIKRRLTAPTKP